MGKGKKKDTKKKPDDKVAEDLGKLTTGDDAPSTSTRKSSIPPEDVVGLSGKARKQREKELKAMEKLAKEQELAKEAEKAEATTSIAEETVAPVEPVVEVPKKQEDDDEGVYKRKRRPKKKPAATGPEATAVTKPVEVVSQPVVSETQRPLAAVPHSAPTTSREAPSVWGRPAQTQPIAPAEPAAWQTSAGPSKPTPSAWQRTPTEVPPESGRSQASQVAQPSTSYSAQATSSAPVGVAPPSGFSQSQPPIGRGRGRGTLEQRTPSGSQQPAPIFSALQKKTSDTTVSRFKIPSKIIGKTVPSSHIKVLTNYLAMKIDSFKVYRYDVSVSPDKPKKMIPKAFQLAKAAMFPDYYIAFDQMKNCYSRVELPNVTQNTRLTIPVEIKDPNGKAMNFEVSFKATGIVNLETLKSYMSNSNSTSLCPPTEAIQCIDVILRQGTLENYIKAGRQFFKRPANPITLGYGLEMWTGLFQSAIFTSRAFINIDVAHKGFPKHQTLVDAIKYDFGLDPNLNVNKQRLPGVEHFVQFVKGLRVIAIVAGESGPGAKTREYICNEIADSPARLNFDITRPDGKKLKMSVLDYFQHEKNHKLNYPDLNCLWVGPRDKKIFYPMELLTVAYGQALNRQLNDQQLSKMVKEAATKPDERKRKIEEVISDMKYSDNTYFKHFGLQINKQFSTVNAKVLNVPSIETGTGGVFPKGGQWQSNRLLKPEKLDAWGYIDLEIDAQRSSYDTVIKTLTSVGEKIGMRISAPSLVKHNVTILELHKVFQQAVSSKLKFLVIVINTYGIKNKDNYHKIKKMAEREVGVLTQCIKDITAKPARLNDQTARNILLKINSKLMGINQAISNNCMPRCLAGGRVMVVGADVTHPSPEQTSVPSIAAVTASIDPKCFVYNIQLSVQTPKKEMIVEFEDMMIEHLKVYRQKLGALPLKIFVFRDGVSEGQFAEVMNSELQAVHNAYARMAGPAAKVEVLFLLVQKRHHTRFFKTPDIYNNVAPGTVVDEDIVHQRELDFYLVSHHAIKGTARPTRYHAVCNDGNIPHDEVEQLTFYLCHLYARCTRSVSYPTPTYYAHLACLRARSLTYGDRFNNNDLERSPQRLNVMDRILEVSRMFFV